MVIPLLLAIVGTSYAFFIYYGEGNNHVAIAGNLYMNVTDDKAVNLSGLYPMTDEQGIDNGVKYNFSVSGYNMSSKDINYGVYVIDGDEIENKTKLRYTDIKVYLEETINGETTVVYGPVNLQDFNKSLIHVNTVNANTSKDEKIEIDYTLTMWIDERVLISDTETNVSGRSIYTVDEFKNSYTSLKIFVEGLTEKIDMPLAIESGDTYVENNNAYFIVKLSNDITSNAKAKAMQLNSDTLNLQISGTNNDILFSYKDSEGNIVEETSETLDLSYTFNNSKTVEVQVFVIPKNDANGVTDVNLKLTKNGEIIQNIIKTLDVYGSNYCLNNGFNRLYDCILVSDSLASDVETAKVNIANKGKANTNATAPTYTYVEDITTSVENVYSYAGKKFYFANRYEINESTGKFKLYNDDGSSIITDVLSDNYKGYYTCGVVGNGYNSCTVVYRVLSTSVDEDNYTITLGDKITYKITSSIRSEVGLYKASDDYGDSYFYRGDVTNNNVALGGYYWKIVRTNGDESIRMIYSGSVPNARGGSANINSRSYTYSSIYPKDSSPITARKADPTYVGYMYGKNFTRQISAETKTSISSLTEYYFTDSFYFDEKKQVFYLEAGEKEPITGTFSAMRDSFGTYPYTCKKTSLDDGCEVLIEVISFATGASSPTVKYHSYSSVDKASTRTNENSSNAKEIIENWYATNIVNKTDDSGNFITKYVVDGTFCNDRSITVTDYNSGYLLNKNTYYASRARLVSSSEVAPVLECNGDTNDMFSRTPSYGNGLLSYSIGLITADELVLAGAKASATNEKFYLASNGYYQTMTPYAYDSNSLSAMIYRLNPNGSLYVTNLVDTSIGLRPVINISKDVLISSGDGSVENPYHLTLN